MANLHFTLVLNLKNAYRIKDFVKLFLCTKGYLWGSWHPVLSSGDVCPGFDSLACALLVSDLPPPPRVLQLLHYTRPISHHSEMSKHAGSWERPNDSKIVAYLVVILSCWDTESWTAISRVPTFLNWQNSMIFRGTLEYIFKLPQAVYNECLQTYFSYKIDTISTTSPFLERWIYTETITFAT